MSNILLISAPGAGKGVTSKYLKEKYPKIIINEVYSDSLSDLPLMNISKNAYIVKGNKIKKYK